MIETELLVNNFSLDLSENISFPLSFSIADFKNPEQRRRSNSKQVKLSGTTKNMSFFSNAFFLNYTAQTLVSTDYEFNPTLRYPAKVYKSGTLVFDGFMTLTSVVIENGVYYFNIILYSNLIDIFSELKGKKIAELGWSEYDHELNVTNIQNSWDTSVIKDGAPVSNFGGGGLPLGFGYVYPLIDYGYNASVLNTYTNDIYPHVYCKEIILKIFMYLGYTVNSNLLNSRVFRRLIFGWGGGDRLTLSVAEANNRTIIFDADGTYRHEYNYSHFTTQTTLTGTKYTYFFNTSIVLDIGNTFWGTMNVLQDTFMLLENTGDITIVKKGVYNFSFVGDIDIDYSRFSGVRLQLVKNGVEYPMYVTNQTGVVTFNSALQLSCEVGDLVGFKIKLFATASQTSTTQPQDMPVEYIEITNDNTWQINVRPIDVPVQDGDTIEVASYLPDMDCGDFLRSFITMFNMYISEPDALGEITIETLDDFYLGTNIYDEWTEKLDHSKPIEILPSSMIEGKRYRFMWAEEKDYYNQFYFDKYGHGYGNFDYNVQTTYKTGDRDFKVSFGQAIPVQVGQTNIFVPTIISIDQRTQAVKPYKGKPKIYIYNGLRNSDTWTLRNRANNTPTNLNSYPLAHHILNLDNAEFDLNFGTPVEVYYNLTSYTMNNLVKEYTEKFLREITGKDSKLLRAYFKLNELDVDIKNFNRLVMIDNVLYRKNLITDFDAIKDNVTHVELLRVVEADKPRTLNPPVYVGGMERTPMNGGNDTTGGSPSTDLTRGEVNIADPLARIISGENR